MRRWAGRPSAGQGQDVSEKRDLWVPAVLGLAGVGLFVLNLAQGSAWAGVAALVLGLVGAIACLPIRLKQGQGRLVAFGVGVALLLVATVPGAAPSPATALAWVLLGLAFVAPLSALAQPVRAGLLGGAGLFALLGALAAAGVLPKDLIWLFLAGAFYLASQVFSARPRPAPAPPPGPRVCVMGGSFDPFHRGHRVLAEAALRVVDRLLVVPAGQAPHKLHGREPTPFHHRVAMARLGVERLPRTEVLELEGRRAGPSYTMDTLDVIRRSYPDGTRFLVLIGADMFQDFPNWKDWERILDTATLLVAARPGWDLDAPPEFEGRNVPVERLDTALVDVSSTAIREDVRAGSALGERVSPAVQAYVRDHELYHDDASQA
jgi:nicotinate-nucleotide adenylyltransferase